jgi:hypothetical protein
VGPRRQRAVAEPRHPLHRVIEHVYLTDAGGTPLVHLSRLNSDKDPDLIASMFAAIQNFMDDAFHSLGAGDVRSIEIGTRQHVAFGRGHYVLLYLVYGGHESNHLERRVIRLVHEIEARFAVLLREWSGDMDEILPLRDFLVREWDVPARESPVPRPVSLA